MGLSRKLPDELHEVDVIVVGGGTVGCVVASRLADADPKLSILVFEGGPNNQGNPATTYPALYRGNFMPDSNTANIYMSTAEEQLSGRASIVVSGSVLGGSSCVNGLIYTRAQRDDYNSWNAAGWSADELLPYLKKFETYHGPNDNGLHGDSGPVHISQGSYREHKYAEDFIAVMKERGYPEVLDLQDLTTANGISRAYRYVSPESGVRQDTATTYLHPRLQDGNHPNLHVLVESQVSRILLNENKKATGVEYRSNPKLEGQENEDATHTVKSRKLVIISAGNIATPSILERSGIGSPDVLQKAGVPILYNLPGVGNGLQDHQMMIYSYKSGLEPGDTFDCFLDGTRDVAQALASHDKMLSWNGLDASAKIRPTQSEVDSMGPQFRKAWDRDFEDSPNRPLALLFPLAGILGDPRLLLPGEFLCLGCYIAYPYSRGQVHITSPNLDDPVNFRTGYVSDPDEIDMSAHIWIYKMQREVARRLQLYRGETHQHPNFPQGSHAANDSESPSDSAAKDIEYSPEDDEAIKQWIRENVGTAYHSISTCKMAPEEQMGVVDESLSVHGVQCLKIADLSIAPANVSGNTYSTALVIGEKAADIFIKELGL